MLRNMLRTGICALAVLAAAEAVPAQTASVSLMKGTSNEGQEVWLKTQAAYSPHKNVAMGNLYNVNLDPQDEQPTEQYGKAAFVHGRIPIGKKYAVQVGPTLFATPVKDDHIKPAIDTTATHQLGPGRGFFSYLQPVKGKKDPVFIGNYTVKAGEGTARVFMATGIDKPNIMEVEYTHPISDNVAFILQYQRFNRKDEDSLRWGVRWDVQ